jgi:actin-related protein
MNAFDKLLDHCVLKGLKMEDCSKAQVLMTYKITYDQQALNNIAVSMFDTLLCSKVCIISEAQLTVSSLAQLSSSSLKDSPSSVVVVDIGARETTVYPMYEGIEMKKNMVTTRVGGEHITDFLASMLYAKNDEAYNSQMPRRCKEIARHVKEQSAYVAMSYDAAQTTYGKFEFEKVQVMNEVMLQKSTSRRSLSAFSEDASVRDLAAQARRCQKADDIQKTVTTTLLDGTKIDFSIDIERFHCTEVLFNPSLFEDSRECISIVDAVRGAIDSVDELVRDDVRNHIVIAGGSSLLIGLSERLEKELKLKDSNVKVTIALEKDRPTNPSEWSSVAQGASVRVREALDPMKRGTQIDGFHFVTEADFETKGSGVFDTFHIT